MKRRLGAVSAAMIDAAIPLRPETTTSFRIASDIIEKFRAVAKANDRSVRAEIERVLREAFRKK